MGDTGQGRQEEESRMEESVNKMLKAQPVSSCLQAVLYLSATWCALLHGPRCRKVAWWNTSLGHHKIFLWTIWGLIKMQATQQHSALRNKSLLLASASPLKWLVKVSLCKLNHCTDPSSPDAFTEPVCFPKPAWFLNEAAIKKCRISMFAHQKPISYLAYFIAERKCELRALAHMLVQLVCK